MLSTSRALALSHTLVRSTSFLSLASAYRARHLCSAADVDGQTAAARNGRSPERPQRPLAIAAAA